MSGRYRLLKQIGGGGNGVVYLAYDEKLAVHRVVKEVRLDQEENKDWMYQRFISEVHILKEVHHPFVPQITDVISENSATRIVMEFVEGINLQKYIEEKGTVSEDVIIDWGIQLTQIFRYLHGRNPSIIHQDVKPSNVILHPSGRLYLIDFGSARFCTDPVQMGIHCGTKGYAPPELYETGGMPDERTDIYGLGKTLCFCIYGMLQIPSANVGTQNSNLATVLKKCICSDPGERFQTMEKLERALCRISGASFRKRRILRAFTPLVITSVFAGFMIIGVAACCFYRQNNTQVARYSIEHAQESTSEDETLSYYRIALKKAPWLDLIYKSMTEKYVNPGTFSTERAAKLINMLEETKALSVLKRQDSKAYADFCYDLGIGYFYYIGGITGKQDSFIWFSRAESDGRDSMASDKWNRSKCYHAIASYYNSFLIYGEDQSGEKNNGSYADFFKALKNLWSNTEKQVHTVAGQRVFSLVSYEISMEIRDEAEGFLQDSDVTADMILKLLDQIHESVQDKADDLSQEDENNLLLIISDAKKTVHILEEQCEKN